MAEGSSDSLVKDAIVSVLYDTSGPQVNVKGISQDLVRENVIDGNLEQRILSQQTDSDSQHILAQHLRDYGTLESVKRLCRVLRRTANRYHSHASVAEKLDKACGFSSLTAHSHEKHIRHDPGESRDSEMSEEEISEVFRRGSLPLKKYYEKLPPVPFKPYRPTLDYVELAVINRGEEMMRNESQFKKFLHATLQGIDAVHKRLKSIKYVEIMKFDKNRPTTGRRIVISGAPGCGKSTLSRQLCKDLSSGTLHNTYQLVILVELRQLVYRMKEGEQLGLKHLLVKYPYLSSKKVFDAFHCGYGKNVLFILDGYDELDESLRSCLFLREILSPNNPSLFLCKCDVVITTRPVTSGELFELVENPYRNVEILGFTGEHIHVYIDKYFENLENGQVKADKLKEKLEQLPHVRGMCRVPIVLEFVCKVHHILGDQGIPDTQTGIYGTYIVTELFNSKSVPSNSKPPSKVSVQDLLIVSEEDFPGFYELCRKAFECCSSTKGQRLLLTEQDFGNLTQYLNRGSIYGLLFAEIVESVCGSVRLFHYLHKSIQEMLAAVHIAILPDEKHAPLWREQFGRPEMAEIWKYYAGITELKKLDTNILFSLFKKIKIDQKVLLMLSLYEANNQEVSEEVLPVMFSESKISITARSSYEIVAVNYCIKHHPSLTSFKLELIGRKPPIKFGEPLKDIACQISSHPTLKRLKCSGFKEEDWTLFSDGLVPFKSVSTFDIEQPTSAIFSSIAMNSFDLPDLTLECRGGLQGNTPVVEEELCEAWSQCKCKTVKIVIPYLRHPAPTPQWISLLTGVLRGIAQNETSVEFKLEFQYSDDQSYYMERIPGDILTHFTRDGDTLTLNPLNSRCPTGGVSSGESPQTPGSNQTEEPSNKRRHIEHSPLDGVADYYKEALEKHGSVSVEVTRTLFTGPAGVGKSSLKHLLIKGHSKEINASTQLLEKPDILIFSEHYRVDEENSESSSWTFVSDSSLNEALRLCVQQKDYQECTQNPTLTRTEVNPSIHNVGVESKHQSASPSKVTEPDTISERNPSPATKTQTEPVDGAPLTGVIYQGDTVHLSSTDDIPPEDQTTIDLLNRARSNLLDNVTSQGDEPIIKLKEAKFLHVIDSGGQPVFQDILPLLLAIPCTYIQVFDASKSLDDPVSSTLRPQKDMPCDLQHPKPCESQWEFIQSSLSSMHTMAYKFPSEYFRSIINDIPKFRVIFVGTFRDMVNELDRKCKIVNEKIDSLKGKPYYEHFEWPHPNRFFFIDNHMTFKGHRSHPEEGGHFHLNRLRKLISDDSGRFKLDLPLMWFQVELITRLLENKFIKEDELKTFCLEHGYIDEDKADEEFRCLLKLFHVLGFYAHFDLDSSCLTDGVNYVCTDPTVLYKEIARLLTVQYLPRNESDSANMEVFLTEGKISPELCSKLCQIIDSVWLLEVLCELGIAAKLKTVNSPSYFLPHVLPYGRAEVPSYSSVESLCITFVFEKDSWSTHYNLPRGVFCSLVVKLCNTWRPMPRDSDRRIIKFITENTFIYLKEEPSHLCCQIVINERFLGYSDENEERKLQKIHRNCSDIRTQLVTYLQEITRILFGKEFEKIAQCKAFLTCSCEQITDFEKQKIGGIEVLSCAQSPCASKKLPLLQRVWFEPVDSTRIKVSTKEIDGHSFLKLLEKDNQDGVSSGESPQTPGSNPTGEPSNKRRHIEQPPLVGVTESTSSSPAQQLDLVSLNVHSTQSDSSRSSPMLQRAPLPQSPVSSVVDPSSLDAVPMETSRPAMSPSSTRSHISAHHSGDSPSPSYTIQRTHPRDVQYGSSSILSQSVSEISQDSTQWRHTSAPLTPDLISESRVVVSCTSARDFSYYHSGSTQGNSPYSSAMSVTLLPVTASLVAPSNPSTTRSLWRPYASPTSETGRSQSLSSSATSQDIPHLMDTNPMILSRQTDQVVPFSVSPALHSSRDVQMSIPHQNSPSPGTVNQSTLTGPLQRASPHHLSSSGGPQQSYPPPVPQWPTQPMARTPHPLAQYSVYSPPRPSGPEQNHYDLQEPGVLQYFPNPQFVSYLRSILPPHPQYGHPSLQPIQYNQPPFYPSQPRTGLPSSQLYPVYTPPPPQGPLPTEDLPGPSSLSYPPQHYETHPPYPSTHYSHPPTLSGGSGFDCRQFMGKYKDRFLQFVDSCAIAIRLSTAGVIPPGLSRELANMDSTDGNHHLFLHLRSHADRDSLLKLCNVMIDLTGYPNMSSLGRDMKRDLEQPVNTSTS